MARRGLGYAPTAAGSGNHIYPVEQISQARAAYIRVTSSQSGGYGGAGPLTIRRTILLNRSDTISGVLYSQEQHFFSKRKLKTQEQSIRSCFNACCPNPCHVPSYRSVLARYAHMQHTCPYEAERYSKSCVYMWKNRNTKHDQGRFFSPLFFLVFSTSKS